MYGWGWWVEEWDVSCVVYLEWWVLDVWYYKVDGWEWWLFDDWFINVVGREEYYGFGGWGVCGCECYFDVEERGGLVYW